MILKAKMFPSSSGKIDTFEYLTSEEMMPSDESRTEQAMFTYSP